MDELKYAHVAGYVYGTPWAIEPSKLDTILGLLAFFRQGGRFTAEEVRDRIGAAAQPQSRQAGSVAVLPLFGVISHRIGMLSESSGGTSTERFTGYLRQALNDPSIGAILLDVDSPGGTVSGVPELASEILAARGVKPLVAIANSTAASAAYWIASAASELYATPSGEVGSIGVLAAHQDLSRAYDAAGITNTLITAGKFKGEFSDMAPLGEEARAEVQGRVDAYYDMFLRAVAKGRGVGVDAVREGFGEGRMVGAQRAKAEGMIDGIMTLDQALGRAATLARGAQRPTSRAEMTRRRLLTGI